MADQRASTQILVIRPVLKIAGGRVELAWWDGGGAESPIDALAVGGDPDHDWPGLAEAVSRARAEGCRRFVLDLERVPWINSRGLGRLVELWRGIDAGGGRLALVCTSDRIRNILRISQLDDVLKPLSSLADAAGELRGPG